MVGDTDGFGDGIDLRIDYFLPGSPVEAWALGWGGEPMLDSNDVDLGLSTSASEDLSDTENGLLKAQTVITKGDIEYTQIVEFAEDEEQVHLTATLKNIGASAMSGVRFMRSFDPDNTVDLGGSYSTAIKADMTFANGDPAAVVSATSSTEDSYYGLAGATAKAVYVSSDPRALVTCCSWPIPLFAAETPQGFSTLADTMIGIAFDTNLAPGESATFEYSITLSSADIEDIIADAFTPKPTVSPKPTPFPSSAPSPFPSTPPSQAPSEAPTSAPSPFPSTPPSQAPSEAPTAVPTPHPTTVPTPAACPKCLGNLELSASAQGYLDGNSASVTIKVKDEPLVFGNAWLDRGFNVIVFSKETHDVHSTKTFDMFGSWPALKESVAMLEYLQGIEDDSIVLIIGEDAVEYWDANIQAHVGDELKAYLASTFGATKFEDITQTNNLPGLVRPHRSQGS